MAQLIHEAFEKPVTMSPSFPEQEKLSLYQHVDEFLKSYAHICEVKQQEAMEQNNLPLRYWEISSLEMNKKLAEFGQGALHPIETAEGIIEGLHKVGQLMKPLVEFMGHVELGREHGTVNLELANKKYEEFTHNISKIQQHLQSLSPEEKVKFATDLVFDFKVAPVLISKAGKLAGALKNVSKELVQSEHIKKLAQIPEKVQEIAKIAEGCQEASQKIEKTLEPVGKANSLALELVKAEAAIEEVVQLNKSLGELRQMFDQTRKGFADSANKYIKIAYEHILSLEVKMTKNGLELSGLHHDYLNRLEKSGIIKIANKVMGKDGFYKADVWFNGKWYKDKTFFPSHWTRKEVIGTVMEAYDNFKINGATNYTLERDGKFLVEALTKNEAPLNMHITKKGHINSAYVPKEFFKGL